MSIDPYLLISNGTIGLQVAMLIVCLLVLRWKLSTFRFEREVMFLSMLGIGPTGSLLLARIPLDPPYHVPLTTYLQAGMLILLLQMLFWSAFVKLRARHRAEQAILKSAA